MTETVLIVDDDPVQRRLLEAATARAGLATLTAAGGEEALALLAECKARPAVIILDLVMPGLDGLGVLAELRERQINIPVIVQTAQGGIETVVGAMRAGAFDFVVKPVSPERLQTAIGNALKVEALATRRQAPEEAADGQPHLPRHRQRQPANGTGAADRRQGSPLPDTGADRGRIRRRQGADRTRHPGFVRTSRQALHHRQLRCAAGKPRRKHPVRPREGCLHRRLRQACGQVRGGKWRHAFPRRGRRTAAGHPGQAAACHPGRRDRSGRRTQAGQGRHSPHLGNQSRIAGRSESGTFPRRPVLPSQRSAADHTAAARTARGHSTA